MSFSAHADSKGILNLIKHCEPENVVLVHGEKNRMEVFAEVVREMLSIPCYYPANFEDLYIPVKPKDQSYPISLGRSFGQLDFNVDSYLLLLKRGEGLCSRQTIEKEIVVKTRRLALEAGAPAGTQQGTLANASGMIGQAPGGTQATLSTQKDENKLDEEKELVILPHRIVRMSLKDYK